MPNAIVTGGSGFVGGHLIAYLLQRNLYEKIINIDINPASKPYADSDQRVYFLNCDVREEIKPDELLELGCGPDTVIYNLAAICRIPGYPAIDYFRTNIRGAENVCKLAEELGCRNMVFTSSIAPYGASEELKSEESVPQPDNPYGSSKLVAEYIHRGWREHDPLNRHLTILRPGIIFGPGEQANFTRLYESLKKGFFVYPGRRDTKKACVYVKDVAKACAYFAEHNEGFQLYNLVYDRPPSIETICQAITEHTDAGRARFRIPGWALVSSAAVINYFGKLTNRDFTGIHPDRVRKVMISTNISGRKLTDTPFKLEYSLREGIIDWKNECGGTLK